jgi:hypothetical protein
VADIYNKALADLDGDDSPLKFGPSHVVWEDENFDFAEECLRDFDEYVGEFSEQELDVVKRSLQELAKVPLSDRCVQPEEYDDEHPSLYPPKSGIEMVRTN